MKKFFYAGMTGMAAGAALLVAQAQPSFAVAVSDAGAGDVKKQIEQALTYPTGLLEAMGTGLEIGGDIAVEAKDSYYEVTVPKISYKTASGVSADLGNLTAEVTPADDGSYKMNVHLPQKAVFAQGTPGKEGTPVAELTLGSQSFNGIWWPKYNNFTNVDFSVGDVKLTSLKAGTSFSAGVDSISSKVDLKPDSGDVWSGPVTVDVKGLRVAVGDKNQFTVTVDSGTGSTSYEKMNLQVRKDMEDKTRQLLSAAKDKKHPDPAQAQEMMTSMLNGLQSYMDGMGSSYKVSGVTLNFEPDSSMVSTQDGKPVKPNHVHIDTVTSAFNMKDLTKEKGAMSMQIGMQGLSVDGADEGTASILPTASNVEIHFDNLPMQQLSQSLSALSSQLVQSAIAAENATDPSQKTALSQQVQAQALMALATIPQQLAMAGSKLSIVNTYAQAPDIAGRLNGGFTANAASPIIAQGDITLQISGLDEVILKLQELAQKPDANPKFLGWSQMLGMLQMQGAAGKGPDGRSQRTYKLELSPAGQITINGNPLGGAMMPPGAAPATP